MMPNTAPDAPTIGAYGAKIIEQNRAGDAAQEVQRDEPPRAQSLLDARAEEVEAQHVEQDVRDVLVVDEHVRHERPRPEQRIARHEREQVRDARARSLEKVDGDVRDDESQDPRGHDTHSFGAGMTIKLASVAEGLILRGRALGA